MKLDLKLKILILIISGILIAFSPIFTTNPSFTARDRDIPSNYNDEFDHENLKISAVSGKIYIDGNSGWAAFKAAGNCTGNGTYAEPYVIEDLVIDGEFWENGILINNSDVYFKIKNCSVYNSRNSTAGIRLMNVTNSQLIDNYCTSNSYGIYLRDSNNNTISGNIANENYYGMHLASSDYNNISGNNANNNSYCGIFVDYSANNNISGNTVNYNVRGLFLDWSGYNIVSYNTANNNEDDGITVRGYNNIISGNTANDNDYIDLIPLPYPYTGIEVVGDNNTISGNTANNNYHAYNGTIPMELIFAGISVRGDNNNISGNTANNNQYGIYLYDSNYNIVSGNTLLGNDECIVEENCQGNKFSDNGDCSYGQVDGIIPGYNIFFLLGILSVVIFLITKKLRK